MVLILKHIIHINKHVIASNVNHGRNDPPITVKTYKSNTKCHEVEFKNGRIVHSPHKPLSCGARVWIETYDDVKVIR